MGKKKIEKNFLYNRIALGPGPGNFLRLKSWNVFFEKIYFFYMNTVYIRILIIRFLIFLTYFLYLNELNPLFFFTFRNEINAVCLPYYHIFFLLFQNNVVNSYFYFLFIFFFNLIMRLRKKRLKMNLTF